MFVKASEIRITGEGGYVAGVTPLRKGRDRGTGVTGPSASKMGGWGDELTLRVREGGNGKWGALSPTCGGISEDSGSGGPRKGRGR